MSLSRKPSLQGRFQSALRFAVDPDLINSLSPAMTAILFQSALRFAVVPDSTARDVAQIPIGDVSIRFEVRGGSRPITASGDIFVRLFQSALRFAVVSDLPPGTPS